MSGDIEAIGELVTAGVVARAIEPRAGEADARDRGRTCLNCRAILTSAYCGSCGQPANTHRSLHTFGHDFMHSVLHFDGKFWQTLPMLVFRPGPLTRRYVHGERAKFVSPLALFLFSVFAMFAVFSWVGGPLTPNLADGVALTPEQIDIQIGESRAELAALEARRKAGDGAPGEVEGQIAGKQAEIEGLQTGRQFAGGFKKELAEARTELSILEAEAEGGPPDAKRAKQISELRDFIKGLEIGGAMRTLDADTLKKNATVDTGYKTLDDKIRKAIDNPQLFFYKIQSNAYKFSWLLIPLSLPFLWLMFVWKRGVHVYDHLVFITYSLCFATLLLVLMSFLALSSVTEALIGPLLAFGIPVHMFFQLKGAYNLRNRSALWRTFALGMSATVVVVMFSTILILIGALG